MSAAADACGNRDAGECTHCGCRAHPSMRYGLISCCTNASLDSDAATSRACSLELTCLTPRCMPPLMSHSTSGLLVAYSLYASACSGRAKDFGRKGKGPDAWARSDLLAYAAAPGSWFSCNAHK